MLSGADRHHLYYYFGVSAELQDGDAAANTLRSGASASRLQERGPQQLSLVLLFYMSSRSPRLCAFQLTATNPE